jgi:hypothetical protein
MYGFQVNLIIYPVPIRRVGGANRAEFFVKNCQRSGPGPVRGRV